MTQSKTQRIRQEIARARLTMAFIRLGELLSKFDQNQPRVPAGISTGGQWVGTGRLQVAGKWNEQRRQECEIQYELDMLQCKNDALESILRQSGAL